MELLTYLMVFAEAGDKPAGPPGAQLIFMIAAIAGAFYFLILRPQGKEKKERAAQLASVAKGDRVVSIGGIHGVVTKMSKDEKTIELEVCKNTRITMNKSAVATIVKKGKGGNGGDEE